MLWAKENYHKSNSTHLNLTFYDWMVYQTPGGVSYGILTLFAKWCDDRFANLFSKHKGMRRNIFLKVIIIFFILAFSFTCLHKLSCLFVKSVFCLLVLFSLLLCRPSILRSQMDGTRTYARKLSRTTNERIRKFNCQQK
jgi:hypothetical protein